MSSQILNPRHMNDHSSVVAIRHEAESGFGEEYEGVGPNMTHAATQWDSSQGTPREDAKIGCPCNIFCRGWSSQLTGAGRVEWLKISPMNAFNLNASITP